VLTIGLGDDLVMRLSVESIENLRTSLLTTLRACRLPKVLQFVILVRSTFKSASIRAFAFSVQSGSKRIWICSVWCARERFDKDVEQL